MTISLAIKLNGGAAGAPLSIAAGGAIAATLDSIDGVRTVTWSIASADDLSEPGDYTLVTSGIVGETCTFNALATLGTSAILQAVANGDPTIYARVKFFVPSANSLETGADDEEFEGDTTHGTARLMNEAIRAAGTTAGVTATSPLASSGGLTPDISITLGSAGQIIVMNAGASAWAKVSVSGDASLASTGALTVAKINGASVPGAGSLTTGNVLKVSGSSALSYGAVNLAGGSNHVTGVLPVANVDATATPTASKIAMWGGSVDLGAAYFYTAGTVATQGLFRVPSNQIIIAARNAANSANLNALRWNGSDILELGDNATGAGVRVQALGSGSNAVVLAMGGASADAVTVGLKGAALFGALSGATAGDGLLTINAATTDPTGAPSGTTVDTWVSTTNGWQARTGKALTVTFTPATNSAATDQRLDKIHKTVHTSDATTTQIALYSPPAASCFVARFFVTGQQTGTDSCAVYSFEVTAVRAAGAATVTTGTVTTLVDTIGVAGVPSAVASTNDVSVRVQGKAATEIDWCISAVHVHVYAV